MSLTLSETDFGKYIHVNCCNDEGGWFAFFTPDGSDDGGEMMQDGLYVNGCESADVAVQALIKLACEALKEVNKNRLTALSEMKADYF